MTEDGSFEFQALGLLKEGDDKEKVYFTNAEFLNDVGKSQQQLVHGLTVGRSSTRLWRMIS